MSKVSARGTPFTSALKFAFAALAGAVPVKTHCYSCSDGLIQTQGSAGVPKAVYD